MDDKKRNQQARNEGQDSGSMNQQGDQQNVSNEQEQNPQSGDSWNNYQTRELSGGSQSDENFYRNRERGNYEEGQGSDEGGGSLY